MNANIRVRRLIIFGVGLLMVGAIVVQWHNSPAPRAGNETLQLADTAESGGSNPESTGANEDEKFEQEKRELLQLRNEVRQLRERSSETKVEPAKPNPMPAAPDVAQPPTAPIPRAGLTAEWKGMEEHATNNYARALERLAKANSEVERFFALDDVAKMSFAFGQTERAKEFAAELLALGERFKDAPWSHGCGDAIYSGNLVLGRLALEEGAVEDAKGYLLAAGTSAGSPVLGSFGPNMSLARELLQRGEREAVLEYFQRCGSFWKNEKLQQWSDDVNAGRIPDFGANLIY